MSNIVEILDPEQPKNSGELAERHSMAVMSQWANGDVYDERTYVERGKMKFQEAQDAFFEFGRILVVLKEHMPLAAFEATVERDFRITYRAAQKMIQATVKFCSPELLKSAPKLLGLGKSKLFELMSEDDDDLAALANGGTVNGLTLDDMDRMTRNELRAALKDAREETDAARKVADDKNKKIDNLTEQLERSRRKFADTPASDIAEELTLAIGGVAVGVEAEISKLRPLFEQLVAHGVDNGMDHAPTMVGSINQLIRDCEALREVFALPQEAPTDAVPEWFKTQD